MPIWLPRPFKIMANIPQNRIEEMNTVDFYGRIKADSAVNPECLAAEECPSERRVPAPCPNPYPVRPNFPL